MREVRWGIVGAGRIAHTFARDMVATKAGRVQAVAARDGAAAASFAAQYAIPAAHGGYQALYSDPQVDAIYIATPHNFHLTHAGEAMLAGKAVLCEKPITESAERAQQLIHLAHESGTYLMEAMWTWFLPPIRRAKDWVATGRIGRVLRIQADFGYPLAYDPAKREYNAELAGGCLLEMGVYPVAFTALLRDDDPREFTVVARRAPNGVEDDLVATLSFGDCIASLGTSFRAKLRNWAYIIGEEGYIAIPDFWRADECQLWHLDEMVDRFVDQRTTEGFHYQIDSVNEDLQAGRRESTIVPLAASLRVQRMMDTIRALS
ncbi:MAG: Gfo/Idh/MocA family oxidoreductase [Pseudomonadota bacterium]